MSKCQKLDALILATIDEMPKKFASINTGEVRQESERLGRKECRPATFGEVVGWRIVDRRLQALRKAERIRSATRGWVKK